MVSLADSKSVGQGSNPCVPIALIFFLIALAGLFIGLSATFDSQMSDAKFHVEIVRRMQAGEPVNEEITAFIPSNWAYPEGLNKTWDKGYVTTYPKLFHHFASAIPLDAQKSVGIVVAFMFCALLLGIYLIARILGNDLFGWIAAALFILFSRLIFWNYVWFYLNMVFAQLMLNAFIVWAVLIGLWMLKKGWLVQTIVLAGFTFVAFVSTHNLFYSLSTILKNITRVVPILLSIGLPLFCGAMAHWRWKKHVSD